VLTQDVEAFLHTLDVCEHWNENNTQNTDVTLMCGYFGMLMNHTALDDWLEIVDAPNQARTWRSWKENVSQFVLTKACTCPDACRRQHLKDRVMPQGWLFADFDCSAFNVDSSLQEIVACMTSEEDQESCQKARQNLDRNHCMPAFCRGGMRAGV